MTIAAEPTEGANEGYPREKRRTGIFVVPDGCDKDTFDRLGEQHDRLPESYLHTLGSEGWLELLRDETERDPGQTGITLVRVTEAPDGEAPEEIREAWVGMVLPTYVAEPRVGKSRGVVSGQRIPDELRYDVPLHLGSARCGRTASTRPPTGGKPTTTGTPRFSSS